MQPIDTNKDSNLQFDDGQRKQEPVEQIREAVLAYEKDLDDLVKGPNISDERS